MATTMTVENIPEDLYERLQSSAKANHRSLELEVIACLEVALRPVTVSNETHMALAQQMREELAGKKFRVADIEQAIERM